MKMDLSNKYFERAKKVAPGGVHSPVRAFKSVGGQPVFFKSANGAELTTVDGETVIDFCQSFGPLLLGHRDPDVTAVVQEMVQTAWSFGACEPYSLALAEFITSKVPWVEKVRFVSSGTEAVMSALRVARAFTKRHKILKFDGCYHGHADSLLVKAGSGLAGLGDGQSAADSAGVSPGLASETLVAPLDDIEAYEKIFAKHQGEIAAVIVEPLPANYGLLIQRTEFLKQITEIAHKNGALMIFDEVISGFRVSLGGMAELTGIRPDLVTYGKVIGGGFPVGAYGGRAEIMDLVAPMGPVYQAGTLSANPVGMSAGLATLEKVVRENVYVELEKRAADFTSKLKKVFEQKMPATYKPLDISRVGSVFWIHPKVAGGIRTLTQIPSDHAANFKAIFHNCLNEGVYLAPSGYEVGFIGYAHTPAILDEAVKRIERALGKL